MIGNPSGDGGLIHHSDRGAQYVSIRYTERLAEAGVEVSVGSVGDSYDVGWFNHRRLLGPIGNIPPTESEAGCYQQLSESAKVA